MILLLSKIILGAIAAAGVVRIIYLKGRVSRMFRIVVSAVLGAFVMLVTGTPWEIIQGAEELTFTVSYKNLIVLGPLMAMQFDAGLLRKATSMSLGTSGFFLILTGTSIAAGIPLILLGIWAHLGFALPKFLKGGSQCLSQ